MSKQNEIRVCDIGREQNSEKGEDGMFRIPTAKYGWKFVLEFGQSRKEHSLTVSQTTSMTLSTWSLNHVIGSYIVDGTDELKKTYILNVVYSFDSFDIVIILNL